MPKLVLWRQADAFPSLFGGRRPDSSEWDSIAEIVAASGGGIRHMPVAPFMHAAGQWPSGTPPSFPEARWWFLPSGQPSMPVNSFTLLPRACALSEDRTEVLTGGSDEVGWLAATHRVPLGDLTDAAKTEPRSRSSTASDSPSPVIECCFAPMVSLIFSAETPA